MTCIRGKVGKVVIGVPIIFGGIFFLYTMHTMYTNKLSIHQKPNNTTIATKQDSYKQFIDPDEMIDVNYLGPDANSVNIIEDHSSFEAGTQPDSPPPNGYYFRPKFMKHILTEYNSAVSGNYSVHEQPAQMGGSLPQQKDPILLGKSVHQHQKHVILTEYEAAVSQGYHSPVKQKDELLKEYENSMPNVDHLHQNQLNVNLNLAYHKNTMPKDFVHSINYYKETTKVPSLNKISPPLSCPFPQLSQFTKPLTDFNNFPCLPGLQPSHQLRQNGQCVRTVRFPDSLLADKTGCTLLRLGPGTPICTYSSDRDVYVSGSLNVNGMWEGPFVNLMLALLRENPDMAVLDAGCNVGVYTLAAASLGHKVVSIDASYENLYLVSKSLTHGNLWENVSLIWNAISDKHETVVLRKEVDPKNVGGAEIDPNNKTMVGCDLSVNAIVLDDLKDLFNSQKVYIKIDIQGQEHNFFKYGKEFFKMADVRYVQLEYVMHKGIPSGRSVIDSMAAYGFRPYTNCAGTEQLDPLAESNWPDDMCFIR